MLTGKLFNIVNLVIGSIICIVSAAMFFSQNNNNFGYLFFIGLLVLALAFSAHKKNPTISQRLELILLFSSGTILNILPYLVKSNSMFLTVSVGSGILLLTTILLTNFEPTKN